MQAFFTLLNIPVVVPVTFGLIFRRVPKWSAVASITWGLIVGITTRYVLGWDIGPQVYLSFIMSFAIFAASHWLGTLYKNNKGMLGALGIVVAVVIGGIFTSTIAGDMTVIPVPTEVQRILAGTMALLLAASLYGFARFFARETEEQRKIVQEFFKKLDRPVDVAIEVFGAGRKQVSTFPLVGGTTIIMGLLMGLIFFTDISAGERETLATIIGIMIAFGILMWYFGKKSEIRSAGEYLDKSAREESTLP